MLERDDAALSNLDCRARCANAVARNVECERRERCRAARRRSFHLNLVAARRQAPGVPVARQIEDVASRTVRAVRKCPRRVDVRVHPVGRNVQPEVHRGRPPGRPRGRCDKTPAKQGRNDPSALPLSWGRRRRSREYIHRYVDPASKKTDRSSPGGVRDNLDRIDVRSLPVPERSERADPQRVHPGATLKLSEVEMSPGRVDPADQSMLRHEPIFSDRREDMPVRKAGRMACPTVGQNADSVRRQEDGS